MKELLEALSDGWEVIGMRLKYVGGSIPEYNKNTLVILYHREKDQLSQLEVDLDKIPPYNAVK
jgi:hypothetical protein